MTNIEETGTIYKKECDNCGKTVVMDRANATPLKWFRLERIKMLFRAEEYYEKSNGKKTRLIPSANACIFEGDTDPDFCTRECAEAWFSNQLEEISE